MPKFSNHSKARRAQCHPDLQRILNKAIEFIDFSILEGHRSEEIQNEYFRKGLSKVQYPDSKHNKKPSLAVDIAPYYVEKPHIRWKDKARFYFFAGVIMGIAWTMRIKLRYGGDWDGDTEVQDQTFMDLGHFELKE